MIRDEKKVLLDIFENVTWCPVEVRRVESSVSIHTLTCDDGGRREGGVEWSVGQEHLEIWIVRFLILGWIWF